MRRKVLLTILLWVLVTESIGSAYFPTALQSIEKQFGIPSSVSGFLVSASDIGYLPTVTIIAYFASKGNRMRWIGAGCLLISVTYLIIISPIFIPDKVVLPKEHRLVESLVDPRRSTGDNTLHGLLRFPLIQDRLPLHMRQRILRLNKTSARTTTNDLNEPFNYPNRSTSDDLLTKAEWVGRESIRNGHLSPEFAPLLLRFVKEAGRNRVKNGRSVREKAATGSPYCENTVAVLRKHIVEERCSASSSSLFAVCVMVAALVLMGVGRTLPWSLGVPLFDDLVPKEKVPTFLAWYFFLRFNGQILAFQIGGFVNKLHYTLHTPVGASPSDPSWIGAWWLGFAGLSIVLFFPSLLLVYYSKHAPKHEEQLVSKQQEEPEPCEEGVNSNHSIKDFFLSYLRVLKSRVYSASLVARTFDVLSMKGFLVFLPKYIENQYGLPQFLVQRYISITAMFCFCIGTIFGGFLTRRFKWTGRQVAASIVIAGILNIISLTAQMGMACEPIQNKLQLNQSCADCECAGIGLSPQCDSRGTVFFSACHAGCHSSSSNCSCAHEEEPVSRENCPDDCKSFVLPYFVLLCAGGFTWGFCVIPVTMILMRCVEQRDRTIAFGLQGFVVSLLGTLPSPLLWGLLVDTTCILWEKACSGSGACSIYNVDDMRWRMYLLLAILRGLALIGDLYVFFHSRDLQISECPEADDASAVRERKPGAASTVPLLDAPE